MPFHLQAKLLRVLQEGEFNRLGSTQTQHTDVRIIATSNCDVYKAIEEERFRQDLFFRLNVISVKIPPLRERKDDIPLLVDHFVEKYAQKYSKKIIDVDKKVFEFLHQYHWPGNVRELENVIQRSVLSCRNGQEIGLEHILPHWSDDSVKGDTHLLNQDLSIEEMEKHLIKSTLERHNFHKTKTAEILGVTLKTLRSKILQYNLDAEDVHNAGKKN
jgi:transcriptional regulator with PAS, ATPase and Fis domain